MKVGVLKISKPRYFFFQNAKEVFGLGCSYEKLFLKFQKWPSKTSTMESPFKIALWQRCFPWTLLGKGFHRSNSGWLFKNTPFFYKQPFLNSL